VSSRVPRSTVVIPCYNTAAYVGEAIRSCLNQTVEDLEVIVVDDGSTDASPRIIADAAAQDARVRVVRQENRGLGAARNAGIAVARGEYIAFLDADDLIEPEKLELQGAVLDARPDVGIVLCSGYSVSPDNQQILWPLIDVPRLRAHPPLLEVFFRVGGCFPPMLPLIRRDLAVALGGFEEDRIASGWADTGFWMRLALTGTDYVLIERSLARYRLLPTSMTADSEAMERASEFVFRQVVTQQPDACVRALRAAQRYTRSLEKAEDIAQPVRRSRTAAWHALLHLLAQASRGPAGRPILIWGSGAAGRNLLALLRGAAVDVDGFIDSHPAKIGSRVEALPVVGPDALHTRTPRRPYVLIASMYADQIMDQLNEQGWQTGADYFVSDFDVADLAIPSYA
jgi:hypothetical protein